MWLSHVVKRAFIVNSLTGSDVASLRLAWQWCEDGGVQSHSAAAAAVIVTGSLRLRLRPRLEGGQRPGRAAQPAGHQSRRSPGEGCTCRGCCCRCRRWGLTASKGDRLEAVGGGGLPGGPDPPLPQTHLDQQPGRPGVPAGPQRGKRPAAGLEGVRTGPGLWWGCAGCVAPKLWTHTGCQRDTDGGANICTCSSLHTHSHTAGSLEADIHIFCSKSYYYIYHKNMCEIFTLCNFTEG